MSLIQQIQLNKKEKGILLRRLKLMTVCPVCSFSAPYDGENNLTLENLSCHTPVQIINIFYQIKRNFRKAVVMKQF